MEVFAALLSVYMLGIQYPFVFFPVAFVLCLAAFFAVANIYGAAGQFLLNFWFRQKSPSILRSVANLNGRFKRMFSRMPQDTKYVFMGCGMYGNVKVVECIGGWHIQDEDGRKLRKGRKDYDHYSYHWNTYATKEDAQAAFDVLVEESSIVNSVPVYILALLVAATIGGTVVQLLVTYCLVPTLIVLMTSALACGVLFGGRALCDRKKEIKEVKDIKEAKTDE